MKITSGLGSALIAVCIGIGISLILALLTGASPLLTLKALWVGSLGTPDSLAVTINNAVPLILTGMAVLVAFRAGLFNIGGEGQMYMGALGAVLVGLYVDLPPVLEVPLLIAGGALFGALLAGLAGLLRAYTGAHEVISTIMMNYIAQYFVNYMVTKGPLNKGSYSAQTHPINPSARLPVLWNNPVSPVTISVIIALASVLFIHWFLTRTKQGFVLNTVGLNPRMATYAGTNIKGYWISGMMLAGAFAGMAGAVMVGGVFHKLVANFSTGAGFTGIAVALLAKNQPLGLIPAALLFGGLNSANLELQLSAGVPKDVVLIIQAVVILSVAVQAVISERLEKREAAGIDRVGSQ
ncbi:MAG: ABC transporter permease [Firmicutes bacterium]|jgi:ABC-type uncharacterized transport system permease subunit|nr:ABC transporter permease [Bacillota bacterium]